MSNNLSEFTPEKTLQTNQRSVVGWIVSHAARHWFFLFLAVMGAVGNAVLAGVQPLLIGRAFNVITDIMPDRTRLLQLALWLAVTQAVRSLLQFARNGGFEMVAQRVERDIRHELYTCLLGKSMTFHSLQPVGDTMARATNDVREVNFLFSPGLSLVIGSINFLIVPVFVAPSYHPSLILTPLIFILMYVISLRRYLKRLGPVTDEVRVSFGVLNARLAEVLDGIETVKGAAQESMELERFGQNIARYRMTMIRQGNI
ncbi:MAG: ABC transporter ATP-binding protein, partial [Anaerolineales bacterium]